MSKLEDLQDVGVRDQRPTLLLLLAASLLLLVIACANVAGLLLVRSVTRAREIATRIALGASAARLGWQFFLEGALVSIAGAALGILREHGAGPRGDAAWPRVRASHVGRRDGRDRACGRAGARPRSPPWRPRSRRCGRRDRRSPADALEAGVRVSVGARARRVSQALVVAEIATAFALLVAGGALALRLRTLGTTPPGFDPDHLLAFSVDVPASIAARTSRCVREAVSATARRCRERRAGRDDAPASAINSRSTDVAGRRRSSAKAIHPATPNA